MTEFVGAVWPGRSCRWREPRPAGRGKAGRTHPRRRCLAAAGGRRCRAIRGARRRSGWARRESPTCAGPAGRGPRSALGGRQALVVAAQAAKPGQEIGRGVAGGQVVGDVGQRPGMAAVRHRGAAGRAEEPLVRLHKGKGEELGGNIQNTAELGEDLRRRASGAGLVLAQGRGGAAAATDGRSGRHNLRQPRTQGQTEPSRPATS